SNHSALLGQLGRRDEGLAASQEAVEIRRNLARGDPDEFLPFLAGSLNNLSVTLYELRRPDEALGAAQEAVDIYRRLGQGGSVVFSRRLATGLHNLGRALSELGRLPEAAAAQGEARLLSGPGFEREISGQLEQWRPRIAVVVAAAKGDPIAFQVINH